MSLVRVAPLPSGSRQKRIPWIQACKGLGIILLVVLHVCAESSDRLSATIVWFLKLFRMPMFFIVSGLLFSARPPLALAEKKFFSLIVPYVAFLGLILVLITIRSRAMGVPNPYYETAGIKAVILGGEYLKSDFGVFWFMTCLYFTQVLYNFLFLRWGSAKSPWLGLQVIALYGLGCAVWLLAPDLRTPWAFGVVPFGLVFFWLGNVMKSETFGAREAWLLCAAVIAASLITSAAGGHYQMDLKYAEPGVPILGVALAAVMTWLFFQLMKGVCLVPWVARPLEVVGEASMIVMFLHQFVHFTLRQVGVHSEPLLIIAATGVPLVFWLFVRQVRWASVLFLGTGSPSGVLLRHRTREHLR